MAEAEAAQGPQPDEVPFSRMVHEAFHKAKTCNPCLFYMRKEDGCRKGEVPGPGKEQGG